MPKNPKSKATANPITEDEIEQLLYEHNGLMEHVAKAAGYHVSWINRIIRNSEKLQKARDLSREQRVDAAEGALQKLIESPRHKDHFKAVSYTLSNLGKSRGFGRTDVQVTVSTDPLNEARALLGITLPVDGEDEEE
jgi:hypothetical protein